MRRGELSPQHEKFCNEYIRSGNASESYRIAFPRSRKWLESSVNVEASKLLRAPKIAPRIEQLRAASEKKLGMSREKWLARLADLADASKPDDVALRALEQLGKALGYYAPQRVEIDHRHEVRVVGIEARIAAIIDARSKARLIEQAQDAQEVQP